MKPAEELDCSQDEKEEGGARAGGEGNRGKHGHALEC